MIWMHRDFFGEEIRMAGARPWVYLDHGPMAQISESPIWSTRLLGLLSRSGTLALSRANFIEIANQKPGPSITALRTLLDRVGSAFLLLDADPVAVALKMATKTFDYAPMDMLLARDLFSTLGETQNPIQATVACDWLRGSRTQERQRFVRRTKRQYRSLIMQAKAEYAALRRPPEAPRDDPFTVYYAALFGVVAHEGQAFSNANHGLDLMHALVAPAACDFMLLDGGWRELVERVPTPPRRARLFSGKGGKRGAKHQIDAFLDALESWPSPPPEAK